MGYELKLQNGKAAVWEGTGVINAIERYLDCHKGNTVVAWRDYPQHGIFPGIPAHIID